MQHNILYSYEIKILYCRWIGIMIKLTWTAYTTQYLANFYHVESTFHFDTQANELFQILFW